MSTKAVEITFAKAVPAYANVVVQMPMSMDLADFLRDRAGDLMGDVVFSPDWQQASEERVVLARTSDAEIQDLYLDEAREPAPPVDRASVLLREIELRIKELRRLSVDPFEFAVSDRISIEIRPVGEGDGVIIATKDWGYTVVNYGQASLKATVFDGSPALEPIHEVEIDHVDLLDDMAGLPASFPAE